MDLINRKCCSHLTELKVSVTIKCWARCLGELKRKVLKRGIHMLSLSTVRYVSVNSNAAGYWFIICHTQSRNRMNSGDWKNREEWVSQEIIRSAPPPLDSVQYVPPLCNSSLSGCIGPGSDGQPSPTPSAPNSGSRWGCDSEGPTWAAPGRTPHSSGLGLLPLYKGETLRA